MVQVHQPSLRNPCSICGTLEFPKALFKRKGKQLKHLYCVMCERDKKQARYYRNHEERLAYHRAWGKANKERKRIACKKWREKNRRRYNEYKRAYRARIAGVKQPRTYVWTRSLGREN